MGHALCIYGLILKRANAIIYGNTQFLQLKPTERQRTKTDAAVPQKLNAVLDSAGMQ
jgi:hypothetical protein